MPLRLLWLIEMIELGISCSCWFIDEIASLSLSLSLSLSMAKSSSHGQPPMTAVSSEPETITANSPSHGQSPMTAAASERETITNVSPPLSSHSNSTCLAVQNPKNEPRVTKKRSIAYVDDDDSCDGKTGKRHLSDEVEPYVARNFTKEEKWIYNKVAMESENFDCVDVPPGVCCPGLLYPVHIDQLPDDVVEIYENMAKLALASYNKEHGTSFQCVKVIKATTRLAGRMLYHITFQAKDDVAGSTPQNFQTTVSNFNGVDRVDLCRFEQKPKPLEGAWAILLSSMCTDP